MHPRPALCSRELLQHKSKRTLFPELLQRPTKITTVAMVEWCSSDKSFAHFQFMIFICYQHIFKHNTIFLLPQNFKLENEENIWQCSSDFLHQTQPNHLAYFFLNHQLIRKHLFTSWLSSCPN